jgi:acetyl-CoA acetyltransferase
MAHRAMVAGVGMIPFATPSRTGPYAVMGQHAARTVLRDAGVPYKEIQQAYMGYVYGDSASGQSALYGLGHTGIPIINVNNNCSTGSIALWLARRAVESGTAECVLALGFEQMPVRTRRVRNDRPGGAGVRRRLHRQAPARRSRRRDRVDGQGLGD